MEDWQDIKDQLKFICINTNKEILVKKTITEDSPIDEIIILLSI